MHKALNERIERAGLQTSFGRILVPSEEVVEVKGGQKSITERRIFPGYVLVEMDLTDETWHLVRIRTASPAFGWLGKSSDPDFREGSRKILSQMEEGVEKPRPKILFEVGEMVRVKEGPFADFNGNVEESTTKEQGARVGHHFWSRHARRTRFQPGRKDLTSTPGSLGPSGPGRYNPQGA